MIYKLWRVVILWVFNLNGIYPAFFFQLSGLIVKNMNYYPLFFFGIAESELMFFVKVGLFKKTIQAWTDNSSSLLSSKEQQGGPFSPVMQWKVHLNVYDSSVERSCLSRPYFCINVLKAAFCTMTWYNDGKGRSQAR